MRRLHETGPKEEIPDDGEPYPDFDPELEVILDPLA
jgi:hypothetical protein